MKIEHLALWTQDLERLRDFYLVHFYYSSGPKYTNPTTGFSSYFLTFPEGGARLELMPKTGLATANPDRPGCGLAHFALSLRTEIHVRTTTDAIHKNGVPVRSKPRKTGDGYYESAVSDPDGNRIELTV